MGQINIKIKLLLFHWITLSSINFQITCTISKFNSFAHFPQTDQPLHVHRSNLINTILDTYVIPHFSSTLSQTRASYVPSHQKRSSRICINQCYINRSERRSTNSPRKRPVTIIHADTKIGRWWTVLFHGCWICELAIIGRSLRAILVCLWHCQKTPSARKAWSGETERQSRPVKENRDSLKSRVAVLLYVERWFRDLGGEQATAPHCLGARLMLGIVGSPIVRYRLPSSPSTLSMVPTPSGNG